MQEEQSVIEARATHLVRAQQELLDDLIALRIKRGLSQDEVGDKMGVSLPTVVEFESHYSNPELSAIRRYALAVGARIESKVIDDFEIQNLTKGQAPKISETDKNIDPELMKKF